MKPTIEQLNEIQIKNKQEKQRIDLAISLDICPECGSKIISQPTEILDKPVFWFFGLFKKTKIIWSYRKICSTDKSHYEDKNYYDDIDWGY